MSDTFTGDVQKRNSLKGLKDNLLQRIAQENGQNTAVKVHLGTTVNAKTLF